MFTATVLAAAFSAGLLNGLGGSGGVVLMSALLMLGLPPVSAAGVNKVTALLGSGGAVWNFLRRRKLALKEQGLPVAVTATAAVLGAVLALAADERTLGRLFSVLILLVLLLGSVAERLQGLAPRAPGRHAPRVVGVVAAFSGFYNGLFGPGTLVLTALPLRLLAGVGMVEGLAAATLWNATSNLVACATFGAALSQVFVLPAWLLALVAAANFAGHYAGSAASIRGGERFVRAVVTLSMLVLFVHLVAKYWFSS